MNYSTLLAAAHTEANAVTLELTPDWLQGRSAYGGWQAALAVLAMRAVIGEDVALRSLQVNFIAPVPPGAIVARAELLRQGKSVTQLEARILVDGKVAFTAIGIFGAARASSIVERPQAPPAANPPQTVADWPYVEGRTPEFMRNFHMRWGAGKPPYSAAADATAQIFVRFRADSVAAETHLVCLADAIPPSAISLLKTPSMLSSINWTLELVEPLHEDERDDWFRFDTSLTAATDGYAWQNTSIWSAQGNLVALSRQCVAVFA
ncbi:MAG TPA: thioesterase family protein [Rhodocyclaceae bacterium]|nr:thioesterase family protein [Rhodocyclaceae bacterium]